MKTFIRVTFEILTGTVKDPKPSHAENINYIFVNTIVSKREVIEKYYENLEITSDSQKAKELTLAKFN